MSVRNRGVVVCLVAVAFAVAACGTKQTLDDAIHCDQFKRQSDGSWSVKDVSLDYIRDGKQYQFNWTGAATITGKQGSEEALILAALDKKCVAGQ